MLKNEFKDRKVVKEALEIMSKSFQSGLDAVNKVVAVLDDPNSSDSDVEKEFIYMMHKINSLEKELE